MFNLDERFGVPSGVLSWGRGRQKSEVTGETSRGHSKVMCVENLEGGTRTERTVRRTLVGDAYDPTPTPSGKIFQKETDKRKLIPSRNQKILKYCFVVSDPLYLLPLDKGESRPQTFNF